MWQLLENGYKYADGVQIFSLNRVAYMWYSSHPQCAKQHYDGEQW